MKIFQSQIWGWICLKLSLHNVLTRYWMYCIGKLDTGPSLKQMNLILISVIFMGRHQNFDLYVRHGRLTGGRQSNAIKQSNIHTYLRHNTRFSRIQQKFPTIIARFGPFWVVPRISVQFTRRILSLASYCYNRSEVIISKGQIGLSSASVSGGYSVKLQKIFAEGHGKLHRT